ncbi:hypothetical protein [Poriferisphaera sp. WC338]|uniref:hypothetical protein n=1 Tax=Poriferisphaera sp. WC338 TaxID=3425129 RepID=UPI003D81BDC3
MVCSLWTARLAAQPFAEYVPGDAYFYLGWEGTEKLGQTYTESNTKAILDLIKVDQMVDQVVGMINLAEGDKFTEEKQEAIRKVRQLVSLSTQMPFAIAVVHDTTPDHPTGTTAVFFWKPGVHEQEVNQLLDWLLTQNNHQDALMKKEQRENGEIILTISDELDSTYQVVKHKTDQSIASNAMMLKAKSEVSGKSIIHLLVNAEKMFESLWAIEPRDQPKRVISALGLDNLEGVAYTGAIVGKEWESALLIAAPQPRKGLLSLLDTKPVDEAVLKAVPKTANYLYATRLDLKDILAQARTAIFEIDPESMAKFEQALSMVSAMTGVNIENQLINGLGDAWVMYSDPAVAGPGGMGICLVNKLREPADVKLALDHLVVAARAQMQGKSQPGGFIPQIQKIEYGGIEIYTMPLMMFSPAIAVKDDHLLFGLTPQSLAVANDHLANGKESILDNPHFMNTVKILGVDQYAAVHYSNLGETAPVMYQQMLMVTQMISTFSQGKAPNLSMVIPPLGKLMPFMTHTADVSYANSDGYVMKSHSPFPGAMLFSPHGSLSGGMTTTGPLAVGIMLPALGAARRTARQMQCNTQLRGLHQAQVIYAQSNRSCFTNDISDLTEGDYFTIDYMLSPFGSKSEPADYYDWSEEKRRQWARDNTDFIFVPNLMETLNTQRVAGFMDPNVYDMRGTAIVYNDNHVEWHTEESMMEELDKIERQNDGLTWQQCIELMRKPQPFDREKAKFYSNSKNWQQD